MKPRLVIEFTKNGAKKWRCSSEEHGYWSEAYTKEGTGYTPLEAYNKWRRCGSTNRTRRHERTDRDHRIRDTLLPT